MSIDQEPGTGNPFATWSLSTVDDMPLDSATVAATTTVADTWSRGLAPASRRDDSQPYSGMLAAFIVLLALIAMGAHNLRHIFGSLDTELFGTRRRNNAFDSHTAAESRTLILLILLACACEAVLTGAAINLSTLSNGLMMGALFGVTAGYYVFQLAAYSIVGYTFTDSVNSSQWLKGFNLSQGVLGLLLVLPTLTLMFYPKAAGTLLIICIIMYVFARVAYLCKGFRIFYNGLPSLVYFILYLCALEIIPVILVGSIAKRLSPLL